MRRSVLNVAAFTLLAVSPACGDTEEGGSGSDTEDGTGTETDSASGDGDATADGDGDGDASADGTSASGSADTGSDASGGTSTSGTGTDGSASGESGSTGGTTGDGTGTASDTGTGTGIIDEACKQVDVIFSVDNSGSMQEEIAALTAQNIFDNMVNRLLTDVGNDGVEDFNFAFIDACPKRARYHNWGAPGGVSTDCMFDGGLNYLQSTQMDPLDNGQLSCVVALDQSVNNGYEGMADVCIDSGAFGDDDEQPAFTAGESLADADNSGFLRAEAILFVVAMTDEDEEMIGLDDDTMPLQTPQEIADMFIDAKGGHVENVVFLGISGDGDCSGPYGGAIDSPQLQAITQIFVDANRGLFWDICQGNLDEAVDQAIDIVASACVDPG